MFCTIPYEGWNLLKQVSESISALYLHRSPLLALLLVAVWLGMLGWAVWDSPRREAMVRALDERAKLAVAHEGWIVPALALTSACASLLVCIHFLGASPHSLDELVFLFGARTLAQGQLWVPAPPEGLGSAFKIGFILQMKGRLFSKYPPGWSAVLAVGVWAGSASPVNPLLNGLTVVLFHRLLSRWTTRPRALVGTALLALSPAFIVMGATLFNHSSTLLLHVALLLSCTCLAQGEAPPGNWVVPGVLVAALALIRPLEAVILSVVPVSWALGSGPNRSVPGRLLAMAVGPVVAVALLVAYNQALTGRPHLTLYEQWNPMDHYGFGPDVGVGYSTGHNLFKAWSQLQMNLQVLNEDLLGWPMTSLLLPAVAVLLPAVWSIPVRVSLGACAVVSLAYAGYHHPGIDQLSRYYSSLIPLQVFLAVEGLAALHARFGPSARPASAAVLTVGTILALATWWPTRLADLVDSRTMLSFPEQLVPATRSPTIFVVPEKHFESFSRLNALDLQGASTLFVRQGPWVTDGRLAAAFPGHQVVSLEIPIGTGTNPPVPGPPRRRSPDPGHGAQ